MLGRRMEKSSKPTWCSLRNVCFVTDALILLCLNIALFTFTPPVLTTFMRIELFEWKKYIHKQINRSTIRATQELLVNYYFNFWKRDKIIRFLASFIDACMHASIVWWYHTRDRTRALHMKPHNFDCDGDGDGVHLFFLIFSTVHRVPYHGWRSAMQRNPNENCSAVCAYILICLLANKTPCAVCVIMSVISI